jgi:murein tripeptide amidase MpaA
VVTNGMSQYSRNERNANAGILLHQQLESIRLVFVPVVNPGGMWRGTRANPNGVDLMRNAPVDALERTPFLLGGHRLGAGLPWYRARQAARWSLRRRRYASWSRKNF